eukprot:TRINITY_DN10144_c0_g1_i1.p1 TRINITY_DN10144_c0_g1~~TRINITY_DN10144_c0_g1_i1.p1  ORF type:complete len:619 (+),score=58.04 TRINITY_DN10144_c0_g1_i1:278-2134(+)
MLKAQAEFEVLQSLQHPNIVQTYAFTFDQSQKISSIYMEYLSEGSLYDVIRGSYPDGMPVGLIRKYTEGVLQGLHCAHSKGLIHRDIKPANMLVGTDGELKLADFGLCKRVSDRTSVERQCVGTIRYMSPRSFKAVYDIKSDLWAVGCTLIEMATGSPPYADSDLQGISLGFAIGNGSLRPQVPMLCWAFTDFVDRCLDENGDATCESLLEHEMLKRSDSFIMEQSGTDLTHATDSFPHSPSNTNHVTHHVDPTVSMNTFTDSGGIHSLVEWLRSKENDEIQSIINPAEALEALIRGGCGESMTQDYPFQRVLLNSCLRYISVLFCKAQTEGGGSGQRHFKDPEVQQIVERCLRHITAAEMKAGSADPDTEQLASFQFMLTVVKAGLRLIKEAGVVESHVVVTQTAASDALLRRQAQLDDAARKVLNSYKFVHDSREHSLFTKVFKLICGKCAAKFQNYIPTLCEEMQRYWENDDTSEWEVKYACLETLYQLTIEATDGRLHHDAFFGASGVPGLLLKLEDPSWRVREKAAELVLALLHVKSVVPMHGTVTVYIINKCLGMITKDSDVMVQGALKSIKKHIINRPAIDWGCCTYTLDVDGCSVLELAKLKSETSEFKA